MLKKENGELEQGFHIDQPVISHIKNLSENETKLIQLSLANNLIIIQRPIQLIARTMFIENKMQLLPKYLELSSYKNYERTKEVLQRKNCINHLLKITQNDCKCLYNFFNRKDFICIYKRYRDERNIEDQSYDFTAKIKYLNSWDDFNPNSFTSLLDYQNCRGEMKNHLTNNNLIPLQDGIQFDSNFESGNLHSAYLPNTFGVKHLEYYLLLENDTNTHGYNQWFFFRIRSRKKSRITLHISNLIKRPVMFKQGMQISIFSQKAYAQYNHTWIKGGENITCSNSRIRRPTKQNQNYYALSFEYEFNFEDDLVYFALNIPYTYSRLVNFLQKVQKKVSTNLMITRKNIGYSHAQNIIMSLSITSSIESKKKVILILGRQHPVQTAGSFKIEGLIEYLIREAHKVKLLINKYIIVVIPMLNPDGVIHGHSRCNMAGIDINRHWNAEMNKELSPETFQIKKYIKQLNEEYGIELIIDLHGHSKKMNSFMYGCKKESKVQTRFLPYIMSKIENKNFSLESCSYNYLKQREMTVRGEMTKIFGINCFTLESSYFGREKDGVREHFTQDDLKGIGESLIKSLMIMFQKDHTQYKLNLLKQLQLSIERIQCEQESKFNKINDKSDSDPDGDLFDMEQRLEKGKRVIAKQNKKKNQEIYLPLALTVSPSKKSRTEKKCKTPSPGSRTMKFEVNTQVIQKPKEPQTQTFESYKKGINPFIHTNFLLQTRKKRVKTQSLKTNITNLMMEYGVQKKNTTALQIGFSKQKKSLAKKFIKGNRFQKSSKCQYDIKAQFNIEREFFINDLTAIRKNKTIPENQVSNSLKKINEFDKKNMKSNRNNTLMSSIKKIKGYLTGRKFKIDTLNCFKKGEFSVGGEFTTIKDYNKTATVMELRNATQDYHLSMKKKLEFNKNDEKIYRRNNRSSFKRIKTDINENQNNKCVLYYFPIL